MNSLNLLSSRVIGLPSSPSRLPHSDSSSHGVVGGGPGKPPARARAASRPTPPPAPKGDDEDEKRSSGVFGGPLADSFTDKQPPVAATTEDSDDSPAVSEKTPLLSDRVSDRPVVHARRRAVRRLADALAATIRTLLAALASPVVFVARAFRDVDGSYSLLVPVRRLRRGRRPPSRAAAVAMPGGYGASGPDRQQQQQQQGTMTTTMPGSPQGLHHPDHNLRHLNRPETDQKDHKRRTRSRRSSVRSSVSSSPSLSPSAASDSETTSGGGGGGPRRSIRIRVSDAHPRPRRSHAATPSTSSSISSAADLLKSPMGAHRLTKYPHTPMPPRPLIPLRQPSYGHGTSAKRRAPPSKTLILDLDETLIHSLAKGGRMSSGHMVEVKLSTPMTAASGPGSGPPTILGPAHPILYYVHKRPHCDDFLRKVSKWYRLVVFTASVQEYADPVIDWLESERSFFAARYYRQHCTFRNGAYIKDVSAVEPDLSKVMIVDNSPMSYSLHEGE